MTKSAGWLRLFSVHNEETIWRYAGARATSQWVVLPVLVFLSFNAVPAGFLLEPEARIQRLQNVGLALVIAWLFFTVVGLVINSVAEQFTAVRVVLINALFALTESVRIFSFYWLNDAVSHAPVGHDFVFTVVGSLLTGLVFLGIVSTAINDSYDYQRDYKSLAKQRQSLQASIEFATNNIELTKDQLITTTREQVLSALSQIVTPALNSTGKQAEVVDELFRISDEVVRPLSHQLSNAVVSLPEFSTRSNAPRERFSKIFVATTTLTPFRPVEFSIIVLLITLPALFLYNSLVFAGYWTCANLSVFITSSLGQKYLTPLLPRVTIFLRTVVISIIYLLPILLSGALVALTNYKEFIPENLLVSGIVYGAILLMVLGWLVALSQGLQRSRARVLVELNDVNLQLTWANARVQAQLWLNQKRLALTLHNDVQSTLLAAALKLRKALHIGVEEVAKEIPAVQELIAHSVELAGGDVAVGTVNKAVTNINQTWGDLMTLTVEVDPADEKLLNSDSLAVEVLAEVLSEFQINSLKHGKATKTHAQITFAKLDTLAVVMTNNGNHMLSTAQDEGLGSAFIDAVTMTHSIENNIPIGVQLSFELPCSPA